MTLNKMLVIGNVGTDPEMRYTPNGNPVTSFRLATSRRYTTSEGEQREETEWFTVSAWNRLAETCNQYVTKGMKVYVEGRLKSDEWVGQDGQARFRLEINANEVKFLDRAPSGEATGGESTGDGPPPSQEAGGGDVEDLPW
jgi:single-strand DNA-binding protein